MLRSKQFPIRFSISSSGSSSKHKISSGFKQSMKRRKTCKQNENGNHLCVQSNKSKIQLWLLFLILMKNIDSETKCIDVAKNNAPKYLLTVQEIADVIHTSGSEETLLFHRCLFLKLNLLVIMNVAKLFSYFFLYADQSYRLS